MLKWCILDGAGSYSQLSAVLGHYHRFVYRGRRIDFGISTKVWHHLLAGHEPVINVVDERARL